MRLYYVLPRFLLFVYFYLGYVKWSLLYFFFLFFLILFSFFIVEFRSDPQVGKFSFYALIINSTVILLLLFVSSVYSVQLKNPFFIFPASSSSSMKSCGRKLRPVPAASARNLTRSFQCLTCSTPRCLRHVVGSFNFCYY